LNTGKVKVCFFAPIPPPFIGSSYAVQLLLESKFSKECNVTHINTVYSDSVENIGKFEFRKIALLIKYLWTLVRTCKDLKIEYIVLLPAFTLIPFVKDSLTIFVVYYLTSSKVILWSHSNNLKAFYIKQNPLMRWHIRTVMARVFHGVIVGENLKYNFEGLLPERKISVIYNGAPPLGLDHKINREESKCVRVMFLSNMIKTKGWLVLLAAASKMCGIRGDIRFDFFGSSSNDSSMEEITLYFSKIKFPDRIQYWGPIFGEEKKNVFVNADIFCLPTYYAVEAFPLVILEAMQFGLAIISTNLASITEALVHEEGGLIVSQNNVERLIDALVYLADHPDVRKKMGEFNKRRVEEQFGMDRIAEKWITLIKQFKSGVV